MINGLYDLEPWNTATSKGPVAIPGYYCKACKACSPFWGECDDCQTASFMLHDLTARQIAFAVAAYAHTLWARASLTQ